MIQVYNLEAFNFHNATMGMRNAHESWEKSDSYWTEDDWGEALYILGENDLALASKLVQAGTDHSKFMRQIFVTMNIKAPIYWWKEMDTYKVSTVANSTSTMHTLCNNPITKELFSLDENLDFAESYIKQSIDMMESLRQLYLESGEKKYWRALIQLLPESFNQMRTWTANYQTLRNIYHARKNHKLIEWKEFCKIIEQLPYFNELIGVE